MVKKQQILDRLCNINTTLETAISEEMMLQNTIDKNLKEIFSNNLLQMSYSESEIIYNKLQKRKISV